MPEIRWASYRLALVATIGDTAIPAIGASVTYTLNGVPECTIRLPVGRWTKNLQHISPVHARASEWKNQLPVVLSASVEPFASAGDVPDLGLPTGYFTLFEGLLTGVGYVRQKQGQGVAQLGIRCRHWLSRLDHGSIFSENSHPANPGHYSYGALHPTATVGGDTARGSWSIASTTANILTPAAIRSDFWGDGLYQWFNWLASQDALWVREQGLQGSGKNDGHLFALARMTKDEIGNDYYVPLRVRLDVNDDLASLIAADIAIQTGDADRLAQQTIWDLLTGKLASDYLFAVVPTAQHCLVVPYVPSTRQEWRTLLVDTTVSMSWSSDTPRQLRAVGVLASHRSMAGGVISPDGVPGFSQGVGGWYEGESSGTVMLVPAPRWASSLLSDMRNRPRVRNGVPSSSEPDKGDNSAQQISADERYQQISPFLNSYAQYYYAARSLNGRQLSISGPLRFDIAPGSTLRVQGMGDPVISAQIADELAVPLYGTVVRTTITMDAENRRASTAFHLAYVRTESENNSSNYSLSSHPLYEDIFVGTPLVRTS